MKRFVTALAALIAATAFAAWHWTQGMPRSGLHISGDAAPQIITHIPATAPEHTAALRVVLLARWQNLRHLPELRVLCGADCRAPGVGHVTLVRLKPGQLQKIVLLDLSAFGAAPAIAAGTPIPDGPLSCITARIRAEAASLRPRAAPPCADTTPRQATWILPLGLGRL